MLPPADCGLIPKLTVCVTILINTFEGRTTMKRFAIISFFILITTAGSTAYGQQDKEAARIRTRELLAKLLTKAGPDISIAFAQSQKQPFNYTGTLKQGLAHAESLEVVVSVTA